MKGWLFIPFAWILSGYAAAQEVPAVVEQQLENISNMEEVETEDDSYILELEQFAKHPLNLNTADREELEELRMLNDLQLEYLLAYRKLFGSFLTVYELQAVPGWGTDLIRRLLPFITVAIDYSLAQDMKSRFNKGEHSLLWRISQALGAGKSREQPGAGSPQKIFTRYRYSYKNLLQFGLLGEKDAGESFFGGAQRKGFDFYSAHLFVRKLGAIQALAVGDFTVNMGQGLLQWQSLAFKKSGETNGIKRQSAVLRPYSAAGEFNFHRGVGITIRKTRMSMTSFLSFRRLDATVSTDTSTGTVVFTSFRPSGYHRTAGEIAGRNQLQQTAFGGNINYQHAHGQIGINAVGYKFSMPLQKKEEPYNLYAIRGDDWYNLSIDYSYTYKNMHLFGEAAVDKRSVLAWINGVLISVDSKLDVSLLYRQLPAAYQSVNGNAFTENTAPGNETGLYAGLSFQPLSSLKFSMYADIYQFPWLKSNLDAPGYGRDYLLQLNYTPVKEVELYSRYRNESRDANQADLSSATRFIAPVRKQNWRTQLNFKINRLISVRNRLELVWYNKRKQAGEEGFLFFTDLVCKPPLNPFSIWLRLQYFESDSYDSRLYAYENGVLYSYSVPVFDGRGYRYYLTLNYDIRRNLKCWLRWSQSLYADGQQSKSEASIQFLYTF